MPSITITRRMLRIAVAVDILLFSLITLGASKRDETMSSAAWSMEQDGKLMGRIFRPLIDWIFGPIEADHCAGSWLTEHNLQGQKP